MKKYCVMLSLMLTMLFPSVKAEGLFLGYCDGKIGTDAMGMSGSNAVISEALLLQPKDLAGYGNLNITAINAGLIENAPSYPDSITVWVRSSREGANLASGTAEAKAGWNLVKLNQAIDIEPYKAAGLWIGFSFFQSTKKNVITFTPNTDEQSDCGWICKNSSWLDKSTTGVLPIEALIEGESLPTHNLTLLNAKANPDVVKIGTDIKMVATIRNNASADAVNPTIHYNIGNGAITGSFTTQMKISYREQAEVLFSIPSTSVTDECELTAKLTVTWTDGHADDFEADNSVETVLTFAKEVFLKAMLVEEGTGGWCGFCVRGIVGMKQMREKYPDRFIGIGVHNGDIYTVDNYDAWMTSKVTGFPSAIANRNGKVFDPNFKDMEELLSKAETLADCGIEVSATLAGSKLTFSSKVEFSKNITEKSYNVAYVVVEDKLPITQTNYYAGGSYGELEGFENMASKVKLQIDDVARGIYPSPLGVNYGFPAEIVKNATYQHTLEATMPEIADIANTFVVAILLDGKTGQVVNAAKGTLTPASAEQAAIDLISASRNASVTSYNLFGQPVSAAQKGLVLKSGQKMVIR